MYLPRWQHSSVSLLCPSSNVFRSVRVETEEPEEWTVLVIRFIASQLQSHPCLWAVSECGGGGLCKYFLFASWHVKSDQ